MSDKIELTSEVFIKASPETVFSYLTEQDKAEQWFGEIVDINGTPGGRFHVSTNSGIHATGEFTEVIPHEKVVFTWGGMHGMADGESTVEILLTPENGSTQLSLRHYNITLNEAAGDFKDGWKNNAFPLLKLVAEGGTTDKRCFSDVNACAGGACEKEGEAAA